MFGSAVKRRRKVDEDEVLAGLLTPGRAGLPGMMQGPSPIGSMQAAQINPQLLAKARAAQKLGHPIGGAGQGVVTHAEPAKMTGGGFNVPMRGQPAMFDPRTGNFTSPGQRQPDPHSYGPMPSGPALDAALGARRATPGIMPGQGQPPALQAPARGKAAQSNTSAKPPKLGFLDKLGVFAGMLQDMDGTMGSGNAARAMARYDDKLQRLTAQHAADQKRQAVMNLIQGGAGAGQTMPAAIPGPQGGPGGMGATPQGPGGAVGTGGAPGGFNAALAQYAQIDPDGAARMAMQYRADNHTAQQERQRAEAMADHYGLQGRERLAFLTNAEEYGGSLATNFEAANLGAGQTRVYGDGRDPFHNFDYVGQGQNAAAFDKNDVARLGHAVEARGDQLGYDATMRGHDVSAANSMRSADTAAARLAFDGDAAERAAATGGKRSLSPIYGTDAEGNFQVAQLTADGQLLPAAMPDGFTPQSPFEKAQGRAAGTALGKGAAERQIGLPAQARQLETFRADFAALQDRVALAKSQTTDSNTGPLGQFNPLATDLDGTLKTMRANAGFDKLQEMRDNSPTGGAVGQVSNIELQGLQAAWGNVERSQSQEQLDKNLDAFEKRYAQMLERMEAAYQQDMAAGLFGPAPSAGRGGPGGNAPALPPGFQMD